MPPLGDNEDSLSGFGEGMGGNQRLRRGGGGVGEASLKGESSPEVSSAGSACGLEKVLSPF